MVAVEAVPVATASVAVRVAVADGNDVSAIVMPHRISALCTLILDCARYAAMEKLQVVCDLLLHGLISYRSTVEFQDSAVLFLLLSHRFISPQARYFNHTLHPKLVKNAITDSASASCCRVLCLESSKHRRPPAVACAPGQSEPRLQDEFRAAFVVFREGVGFSGVGFGASASGIEDCVLSFAPM